MPPDTDFDWADELALNLLTISATHDFKRAASLIASHLRIVKAQGVSEGVDKLATALDQANKGRAA